MSTVLVSFHRLASKEYGDARRWYAQRSFLTARRFVEKVRESLLDITANPQGFPLYDQTHRWARVHSFPFLLIFRQRPSGDVVIVAVAHTSRRPGYWKRRKP